MKKILILFLTIVTATTVFAADISFNASVNNASIPLNGSFVYTVTINGDINNIPDPQIGDLSNFNVFSRGKSQSISVINGRVSANVSYNYTLGPKSIGRWTIPPAKIVYNNKTYTTESIDIEVVPSQSVQGVAPQQSQSPQQNVPQRQSQNPNIFVRASTNKKTVYENEKLVYKFSFYTNVDLASNPEYIPPDFGGFWNDGSEPTSRYENIKGVLYLVNEIHTTLYPIAVGKKTISPAQLRASVINLSMPDIRNINNPNDLMQAFFSMSGQTQNQERILQTNPIQIEVLPLPQDGRPNDFYGAVGKFNITAAVDKTDVQTNEPITLTITVSGDGNMKSVTRFDVPANNGMRKYDTLMSDAKENKKVFTTLMTALTPGEKIIPPIKLSFFNPSSKKYETVSTTEIHLNASGEAAYELQGPQSNQFGNSQDIRYNQPIVEAKNWNENYIENPYFYFIFLPFILLLLGGHMFRLFKLSKESKGSINKAQKLIEQAHKDFKKGILGGLFDVAYKALLEAIDSKTGSSSTSLTEKQILENLKTQNLPPEIVTKLSVIFEHINFYKFASVRADEKTLKEMLDNVQEIIDDLS
ncbi:MAG: BatD family protein [Elusimicrobiota bacterium]|nr:BatD family protein [Elusimicrobiota bacterium]